MTVWGRIAVGVLALGMLFSACSESDGGSDARSSNRAGEEPTGAEDAPTETTAEAVDVDLTAPKWEVQESLGQLAVTGAEPGEALAVFDRTGAEVEAGEADREGSLLFRGLDPGDGYSVRAASAESEANDKAPVKGVGDLQVRALDDVPDQSFYNDQELTGQGFGYVTVRDGTTLSYFAQLPGPVEEGPYPVLVEYAGYAMSDPDGSEPGRLLGPAMGYGVVQVNVRGTGCSGGSFDFFEPIQNSDGYDVIEAIAAQDWANDRVGMLGLSWAGNTQLFVAQTKPPSLAAIAPLSVFDSVQSVLYPGGLYNPGFAQDWAEERMADAAPYGQGWEQARVDAGDEICEQNQKLRLQNPDLVKKARQNEFYTPEVVDPLAPRTFVDQIEVPVFLSGAWQDEQTGGHFPALLDKFTNAPFFRAYLFNGMHPDGYSPQILTHLKEFLDFFVGERIPEIDPAVRDIAPAALADVVGGAVPFGPDAYTQYPTFDEAKKQYLAEPSIHLLMEDGADPDAEPGSASAAFELTFDEWPIPAIEPAELYLGTDGALTDESPSEGGAVQWTIDPEEGLAVTAGEDDIWSATPDWKWPSPVTGSAASFLSEPVDQDTLLAGSASADLWLTSDAGDADVEVTLTEVRADGTEFYINSGWLRSSLRTLDEEESSALEPVPTQLEKDVAPLDATEPQLVRVEVYPFAHVLREGSRLRLIVDTPGASRPEWKFEVGDDQAGAVVGVFADSDHKSRLVIPVVPGVEVPTPPPPCPSLRGQPCRTYDAMDNQTWSAQGD